ncbi:MAG: hypothetical protein AABX75_02435 [Nanoarchaeota archaeon]
MNKDLQPRTLAVVVQSKQYNKKQHNAPAENEVVVRIYYAGTKYAEDYKLKIGKPDTMFKSLISEIKYCNSVRRDCDLCKTSALLNPALLNKAKTLEFLINVAAAVKSHKTIGMRINF